jgi:hypothetical protein
MKLCLRGELEKIKLNGPDEVLNALKRKGINLRSTKDETRISFSSDYPIIKTPIDRRKNAHTCKPWMIFRSMSTR